MLAEDEDGGRDNARLTDMECMKMVLEGVSLAGA